MHLGLLIDAFGPPNANRKALEPAMISGTLRLGARGDEPNGVMLHGGERTHERFLAVRI